MRTLVLIAALLLSACYPQPRTAAPPYWAPPILVGPDQAPRQSPAQPTFVTVNGRMFVCQEIGPTQVSCF